jgi:DNA-binding transcriptional LysR family regulator
MDLRRLSYFVLACQEQGFAATAAELGITQSTLSGALKTLSEEVGAPLFEQVQRRLHPTPAGIWLYRSALLLLHAEEFCRNWVVHGPDDQSSDHLVVDVKASFALGRLAKAVSRAIQIYGQRHPELFIQPCFSPTDQPPGQARSIAGAIGDRRRSLLVIDARPLDAERAPDDPNGVTVLAQDPWVVIRAARGRQYDRSWPSEDASYIVPGLGQALVEQASEATGGRTQATIESCDEPASTLPRLIWRQPDDAFLIPRSLAADRLGLDNVDIRPFRPALFCQLVAHHDGDDVHARQLAALIRELLAAPEQNICFRPVLSHRQMRYSRALFERGSITAAARSLSMAQPALTEVLHKLEQTLDCQIFRRSREGLAPTPAGRRLDSAAQLIIEGARRIVVESASVVGGEGGRMKIGVVPSAVHTSITAQCVARAIGVWRQRFPDVRLQVLQGTSSALQNMVASGTIGLAITERTAPGMARFKLAESEPLCVLANPRFNVLPSGPVQLADLMDLPLVLPTQAGGLRQILDAAALEAHLKLVPLLEVNSLPVVLAMIREQPLCTVLPVSSVQNQINSGALRSHPIVNPTLAQQFYAFHAGLRDLNEPEREFLKLLRSEFTRADNTFDIVTPAVAHG